MAKKIKLNSEEEYTSLLQKFAEFLKTTKFTDGKVRFNVDCCELKDRKATVTFSGKAWMKMQYLISVVDTQEVGWYCTARRGGDPEKDEYFLDDVIVYPQVITGATVKEDETEEWTNTLPDEVFMNMKAHGHSHVNFGVTPSGVDTDHQDRVLQSVREDDFFIFFIYNKRGECNWRIFDYGKNVRFDTSDVEVFVDEEDGGFFDFINDAADRIKKKPAATYAAGYSGSYYGSGYSTAGGSMADKGASGKKKGKSPASSAWAWDGDDDDYSFDYPWRGGTSK